MDFVWNFHGQLDKANNHIQGKYLKSLSDIPGKHGVNLVELALDFFFLFFLLASGKDIAFAKQPLKLALLNQRHLNLYNFGCINLKIIINCNK